MNISFKNVIDNPYVPGMVGCIVIGKTLASTNFVEGLVLGASIEGVCALFDISHEKGRKKSFFNQVIRHSALSIAALAIFHFAPQKKPLLIPKFLRDLNAKMLVSSKTFCLYPAILTMKIALLGIYSLLHKNNASKKGDKQETDSTALANDETEEAPQAPLQNKENEQTDSTALVNDETEEAPQAPLQNKENEQTDSTALVNDETEEAAQILNQNLKRKLPPQTNWGTKKINSRNDSTGLQNKDEQTKPKKKRNRNRQKNRNSPIQS